ncbi:MAG: hypothetical protein ACR2HE_06510 [Casimicrobiaceae bacterium]
MRADYDTLVRLGATYLLSSMCAILAHAVRAQGRDEEALELTRMFLRRQHLGAHRLHQLGLQRRELGLS